jgi:hypothetical protein
LSVFLLDQRKWPIMPCSEKRRLLLERDRTIVDRRYRFTIRLKDRVGSGGQVRVKLDPGRRTTGIAVVADEDGNKQILCLFELAHDEIREYVFEKFGRHCAYCGITDEPRSRRVSNRVSNLVAACMNLPANRPSRASSEFQAGSGA